MKKNWTIYGLLFCFSVFVSLIGCSSDEDTGKTATGKVIQGKVVGATVFVDYNANKTYDSGEPSAKTDSTGTYTIKIPDDKEGILCSTGGTIADNGSYALPMLAPRNASNITALTTLVGLNPDLKALLGENWDKDPFSYQLPGKLVQLKFIVESYLAQFRSLAKTDSEQLRALFFLARGIYNEGHFIHLDDDSDLKEVVKTAVSTVVALGDGNSGNALTNTEKTVIGTMTASINYVIDTVDESNDNLSVAALEPLAHNTELMYNPTSKIIPLPNDVAWSATGGKVVVDTSKITDSSEKALYTAVNKLGVSGLSPNTPIAIPLTSSQALDSSDFSSNVIMYSIASNGSLAPVSNYKVIQDDKFIKIYPVKTLAPGAKYLVVVKTGIKLYGTSSTIKKNIVFELLKSGFTLDNPSLEALRASYSPLFTGLEAAGLPKTDVLTLFTFSTASKTLSLTDFGVISQTIASGGNPDDMNITGLPLSAVGGEYSKINGGTALAAAGAQVSDTVFTSLDVTSLSSTPKPVSVPYKVINGDKYSGSVVIYQHGFTGNKDHAQAFAMKYGAKPILAIDLPKHGERDETPSDSSDSGSKFLTTNLGQNRINLYQSFFDISVFIKALKAGKFDINGDGTNDTPSNISFVGVSLGSITGSVAVKNTLADLDKVILNVGGGNFAAIFDTAKNSLLTSVLTGFGLEKNSPQYFISLGVIQLLMDPADSVSLVDSLIASKTLMQSAYGDTIVSNLANEIMASAGGIGKNVYVTDFSTDLTGHSPYFNTAFKFGGDPSMTKNWIPHGFLLNPSIEKDGQSLYPEAVDYLSESYVSDGHDAVIGLTSDFLNN